jgi:serine/threonine-protein kinase
MSDAGPRITDSNGTADLSGRQLGNLHLLRRLGRGAMAEVYLAEQNPLKRWVAVKILKPELAGDQVYLKRFEREAQAAASLVHANIVQIHEVAHVDGLHCIVQEYVQGLNLRDWLGRNGPPDLPRALSIMGQVAAALAKAAEQGVVHRDIKPENIMLTGSGEVKVADFGLARVLRETDATDLTQIGMTMGTPLYMSPEQVEGRPLDPRSDLYSFGVTCYHMLTGHPPFVGDTALAVAVQHVKKEPRPLEAERPDLPAALCRVVHQMLAKDPDRRWQSPRELLRELYRIRLEYCPQPAPEELAQWQSAAVEPLSDPRIPATRQLEEAMRSVPRGAGRRGSRLLAAGAAAVFLFGGLTAWVTARQTPLLPPPHNGPTHLQKQSSALRQWFYASQIGTEDAWRSVAEYYPENEYFVYRAKQQLARIYLRERDYDRAMAVYDELAAASDKDGEFRAFGLAGKCFVLSSLKRYRESADVLEQLWPIHQELRDWQMRRMLDHVLKEIRQKLGAQTGPEWDDWLREQFPPEG